LNIDIDILRTFLEVNRTRHFGQTAANMFVTQSTISARIKLLEQDIGSPVFIRQRNNIQLTLAGQRMIRYAETIVNTWNRARQEVAVEDENKTPLTIGGMPSLWDIVLQEWLCHNYKKFDDIIMNLEILGADTMPRRLLDGTLDLAFMYDPPQFTELEELEIINIPLELVSSTENIDLKSALTNNYALVDWGPSFAIAHARHFNDQPIAAIRTSHGRVALDFILDCGGSAFLANPMVKNYLGCGKLHIVNEAPVIERIAYAIYPVQTDRLEPIKKLLEYFQ